MNDNDTKRLSRLTAILTQLQAKRLLTATALANKFSVSVRTVYRDIRALKQVGIPILTEGGAIYGISRQDLHKKEDQPSPHSTLNNLTGNNNRTLLEQTPKSFYCISLALSQYVFQTTV